VSDRAAADAVGGFPHCLSCDRRIVLWYERATDTRVWRHYLPGGETHDPVPPKGESFPPEKSMTFDNWVEMKLARAMRGGAG
jgi:hypothetical protein